MTYVQGLQYYEDDLFVRERVPVRTRRLPVSDPGTDGSCEPVGKVQKYCSSTNRYEIMVSMGNGFPKGTKDQSVTSTSGEALGWYFHVRRSKRIGNIHIDLT